MGCGGWQGGCVAAVHHQQCPQVLLAGHYLGPWLKYTFTFFVARPAATISSLPSPFKSARQRSSHAMVLSSTRDCVHFLPSESSGAKSLIPTLAPGLFIARQPTTIWSLP